MLSLDLWQGESALYCQLMLRRGAEGLGALLVRHSDRSAVYVYDPAKRNLSPAPEGAWERAAGAIAECGARLGPEYPVLHIDGKTHRLLAGSREVETAGKTVLVLRASPGGGALCHRRLERGDHPVPRRQRRLGAATAPDVHAARGEARRADGALPRAP
jgi:hypothetical protein